MKKYLCLWLIMLCLINSNITDNIVYFYRKTYQPFSVENIFNYNPLSFGGIFYASKLISGFEPPIIQEYPYQY